MRITQTVTEEDCRPTLQGIDPAAPGFGTHLPFFLILQRCGLAWREFLNALGGFDDGVIVPRVAADFLAEVRPGEVAIDVVVTHLGTTSFTVVCTVSQDEVVAAKVEVVLVGFDYLGGTKLALTPSQREVLSQQR